MRLSGAGIIWISMILSGTTVSSYLKNRVDLLDETTAFIMGINLEFNYTKNTLHKILNDLFYSDAYKTLKFLPLCCKNMKSDMNFFEAWSKALEKSGCRYKKCERDKLLSLGKSLGTSDLDSQNKILKLYEEYFRQYKKQAEVTYEKYSKLSVLLGAVSGFGAFIMII